MTGWLDNSVAEGRFDKSWLQQVFQHDSAYCSHKQEKCGLDDLVKRMWRSVWKTAPTIMISTDSLSNWRVVQTESSKNPYRCLCSTMIPTDNLSGGMEDTITVFIIGICPKSKWNKTRTAKHFGSSVRIQAVCQILEKALTSEHEMQSIYMQNTKLREVI